MVREVVAEEIGVAQHRRRARASVAGRCAVRRHRRARALAVGRTERLPLAAGSAPQRGSHAERHSTGRAGRQGRRHRSARAQSAVRRRLCSAASRTDALARDRRGRRSSGSRRRSDAARTRDRQRLVDAGGSSSPRTGAFLEVEVEPGGAAHRLRRPRLRRRGAGARRHRARWRPPGSPASAPPIDALIIGSIDETPGPPQLARPSPDPHAVRRVQRGGSTMSNNAIGMIETKGYVAALAAADAMVKAANVDHRQPRAGRRRPRGRDHRR